MIEEGRTAPTFELPAYDGGAHRRIALEDYLGSDVVILAFYPADFNPACGQDSDLDDLDLFRIQRDVTVLGIGPDTLYSHARFADEYDLAIPLLADTDREVAAAYDLTFEDEVGQSLVQRAVVVIDHDGEVHYAWSTTDLEERPEVQAIRDALAEIGGDDLAFARYRVGHAHYTEGRRAFTSAMASYEDDDWMLAQSDFGRAREEFEQAADHFTSAVRFADAEPNERYYDGAMEKAESLWQAADWLGKSANAFASGAGAEANDLRRDAETPLRTARDIGEPVGPDEWPPDGLTEGDNAVAREPQRADTTLGVEIEAVDGDGAPNEDGPDADDASSGDGSSDGATAESAVADESAGAGESAGAAGTGPESDGPAETPGSTTSGTASGSAAAGASGGTAASAPGNGEPGAADHAPSGESDDGLRGDGRRDDAASDADDDAASDADGDEIDEAEIAAIQSEIAASEESPAEDDDEDLPAGATDGDLGDIPTTEELEGDDEDEE